MLVGQLHHSLDTVLFLPIRFWQRAFRTLRKALYFVSWHSPVLKLIWNSVCFRYVELPDFIKSNEGSAVTSSPDNVTTCVLIIPTKWAFERIYIFKIVIHVQLRATRIIAA